MLKAPLRSFATALFIVAAAFSNVAPAWAADRKLCEAYVAEAIKAAQSVSDNKCGYDLSHPQWSPNPEVHLRWCLKANGESVDKERHNRRTKDTACQICRWYASQAIQSVTTAIKNGCTGLDGPRWSADEQVHFGWCMGLKPVSDILGIPVGELPDTRPTSAEQKERDATLGQCLAQKASQPLVAQPSPPDPTTKASDAAKSTALQRPAPRTSSSVDAARQNTQVTTRKLNAKTKKPKEVRMQLERPCKPADGRPCPVQSKTTRPRLEGGGGVAASGASTSSAMDRLGGGGTSRTSSGGSQGSGSAATRSSAGGGASSATPSGALSAPTGINTTRSSPGPAPGLGLR
jgi:hypothetical protein